MADTESSAGDEGVSDDDRERLLEIAEVLEERLELPFPHVPLSLALIFAGRKPDGVYLDDEGRAHLLAPFWNRVVRLLDDGRGYLPVLLQLDRLRGHVADLDEVLEPASRKEAALDVALAAIDEEIESYGEDATIGSALDLLEGPAERELWRWRLVESEGGTVALEAPRLAIVDDGPLAVFRTDESWGDARDRVAAELRDLEYTSVVLEKRREVAVFQARVVERVLNVYDLIGTVGRIEPGDVKGMTFDVPDISRFRADELLFIHFAEVHIGADLEMERTRNEIQKAVKSDVDRLRDAGEIPDDGRTLWKTDQKGYQISKRSRILAQWEEGEGEPPVDVAVPDEVEALGVRAVRRWYFSWRIHQLRDELHRAGLRSERDVLRAVRDASE